MRPRLLALAGILPCLLMLMLAAGCQRPLKEQVVGKWRETNGRLEVTFFKEGTVAASLGPVQASGNYSTPDEEHVKFELSGLAKDLLGAQVAPAKMKDGRLLLTIAGQEREFTRQK